ncbi:hypothetical protein [Streptomyces olivaceoviridis]|uniref:hypothetical protein n=1 Tax=Streptomyces olivaceoviridis TaxID=1921 RepID=UPI0036A3CD8C
MFPTVTVLRDRDHPSVVIRPLGNGIELRRRWHGFGYPYLCFQANFLTVQAS